MPDPSHALDPSELLSYTGFMKPIARAIVGGDENKADDLFQEAMLAALEKPPNPEIPFRAWITGVMKKLHLFGARTDSRRVRRESIAAQYSLAGSNFPPDIVVQQESERKRVIDAVLSLDDPERSAILFRYYDKLTIGQIAERTNVAEKTVQRRINRSLHKLSRRLDREHGGDGRSWKLAIAPIAGIGLSEVAAAESAFIAASLAAKGAGVALWLKGAAALALIIGLSLTVLHFVQSDRRDNADAPLLTDGDELSPIGPGRPENAPVDRPGSGDSDGLNEMGKQTRVPLQSGQIPFSMFVVDRLDPDRAVTSYHLFLKRLSSPGDPEKYEIEEDVQDPDGYFSTSLPDGGTYRLKVRSPSYCELESGWIYVSPSEGLPDFEIPLDPGVTISGWIIDEEGSGVDGAVVAPSTLGSRIFLNMENGQIWGWTKTDSAGYFELGGLTLSGNRISLFAAHRDYGHEVFLASPQDNSLRVSLKRGYLISGRINDDYGAGTGDVRMLLTEEGKPHLTRLVDVDETGFYQTPAVRSGRVRLQVYPRKSNNSFTPERQYVFVTESDVENIDFGLSNEHCTLTGQLIVTTGFCTTGASVYLKSQKSGSAQPIFKSACDSEGRYEFKKVLPGGYDVGVDFPSSQSMEGVDTIHLENPGVFEQDFHVKGGSITGRVNNELSDAMVVGGFIELVRLEEGISHSTTITISLDSAGEFCFVDIPPGEYFIKCELRLAGGDGLIDLLRYDVLDENGQTWKIVVVEGESQDVEIPTPRIGLFRLVGEGFNFADMQFFNVKILDHQGLYERHLDTRYWSDGDWVALYRFQPGERIAKISFQNIGFIDYNFSIVENQIAELTIERDELQPYEWLKNVSGTAMLTNGQPAAGRILRIYCKEPDGNGQRYSYSLTTLIDSLGQYSLDGVYPGKWSVSVEQRPSGSLLDSSIAYLRGLEIEESDPTYINEDFVIPTGGIRARLIDGETLLPIDKSDACWRAEVFHEDLIVAQAGNYYTPELEINGIPAGTHRLFITVRGYRLIEEREVFIPNDDEILHLGDLLLWRE